jgi:hypothetical protein
LLIPLVGNVIGNEMDYNGVDKGGGDMVELEGGEECAVDDVM